MQTLQNQYALTEKESQLLDLAKQRAENLFQQDLNDNAFDQYTSADQVKDALLRQEDILNQYNAVANKEGKEAADA